MSIASDDAAGSASALCPTSSSCYSYYFSYSYCSGAAAAGGGDGGGDGDAAAAHAGAVVRLVSMSNALAVRETAVQQQQCGMWHAHCGQRPVEQCPHISCGCLHQLRC